MKQIHYDIIDDAVRREEGGYDRIDDYPTEKMRNIDNRLHHGAVSLGGDMIEHQREKYRGNDTR